MSKPELLLQTLFSLDDDGRITGTMEPNPSPGSLFSLIRGKQGCAWAVREDVPRDVADELNVLACEEPRVSDFRDDPLHAERYVSLLEGNIDSGPAFSFPEEIRAPSGSLYVEQKATLDHHFTGWTSEEMPYRTPIIGLVEDGHVVSVCFSARRTPVAAEAGVETAPDYRGRGFAPRVTAAWALAIRVSGRVPLYSTSWTNHASLAVARKLGLVAYASAWSIF